MAAPTVFNAIATNPGGTGSTITVTLSTHALNDLLIIYIANTGNTLWAGNPTGWNRIDQRTVGTSSNGIVGTWFWRKIVSGDSLPLANPVFTLGATVTRAAACCTIRGADLESPFVTVNYGARGFATGTANPARPPSVTTPAPEMLILHCYGSRAATNAPEPSGYTQDAEVVISGTLVLNASSKTEANQNTTETNQDASPTSGVRWAAGILCIPSRDYPYYRSGSQANATATSVTPALPAGTSASNAYGTKDLIIATVEAAGTAPSPNTPGDWSEIGVWALDTSGGATTVRKYIALYDGSLDLRFNRSGSGEISVCLTTYYNVNQSSPIGNGDADARASSTTSTWDAVPRSTSKCVMQATCVADGTPAFTVASGWTERMDGLGITCADQTFNATGSTASASFTLNSASPTVVGLVEIVNASASVPTTVIPGSLSLTTTGFTPILDLVIALSTSSLIASTFAPTVIKATTVIPSTASFVLAVFAPSSVEKVTPVTRTLALNAFAVSLSTGITPVTQALSLSGFAPALSLTRLVEPTTTNLLLNSFAPSLRTELTPSATSVLLVGFAPLLVTAITVTPDPVSLTVTVFAPSLIEQVVPAPESLTLSSPAPILNATITPAANSLALTPFSSNLRELVTPDIFALTLGAFSPGIQIIVIPSSHALSIITFTPSVNITDQSTVIPATASLTTATFAPTLIGNVIVTVQPAALIVNLLAPRLNSHVTALTASLTVSGTASSLMVNVTPATVGLALTPFTPAVTGADQDVTVVPDTDILLLTGSVINLRQFILRGSVDIGSEHSVIQISREGHGVDISFENHAV